jgi:hypothetical protein
MMVRTGLSVEADFLKLVSAVVAMGLAAAQTADRKTTTAADAAIRTTFMAFLSLSFRRMAPLHLSRQAKRE